MCSYASICINEVISVLPNHHGAIYMPYSRKLDASIVNAMTPYPALLLSTYYQVANAEMAQVSLEQLRHHSHGVCL